MIVLGLAAIKLLFHLLTANRYGIFRDEMYGLACAEHLAWGYPDHPPGGIVITWIARHLFGDSLLGLRFLPALAGAALVWLTGVVTRELGGRGFSQVLAAFVVATAPVYVLFDRWLMMNAFEPLVWLGALWCVLRVIHTGRERTWIAFGLLAGIGVLMKYSIVFLVAGVLLGLALTAQRHHLRSRWLWIGLLLAALIGLPNLLWQWEHGFPFLDLMRNVKNAQRDVVRGPVTFLLDQTSIMQPLAAPLWVGGVAWLLGGPERKRYAVFGIVFVSVVGAFVVLRGKNYYPTPIYPIAFAAGAIALERITASRAGRWVRGSYGAAVVAGGLALLPLSAPVLSPELYLRYTGWLGIVSPAAEHQNNGPLPQHFADEFGWEEMVREVARVYHALPPAERAKTAIFSNGWGEAAAVDYFGPKYGLPRAISRHNSYWYWGPRDYTGEIVIVLRTDGVGDRKVFASVEKVGRVEHPYSRRDEWFDIYLCRGLKMDLRTLWAELKSLN